MSEYMDRTQLPLFQDYKVLEHKMVEDFLGPVEACSILRDSLELYRRLRRGELAKRA